MLKPGDISRDISIHVVLGIYAETEVKKQPEDVVLYKIKLDAIHHRSIPVFRYYVH